MSENNDSGGAKTLPRAAIMQLMQSNLQRLSRVDQTLFVFGPLFLAGSAGVTGVVANLLQRRALNLTKALLSSSLPMAVVPFITTYSTYNVAVSKPLLSGELNCPSCALVRSTLVGLLVAGLYPVLLALPINIGLASLYQSSPLPEKGATLSFFEGVLRPALRKMGPLLMLQGVFGTFLGYKHFEGYVKLIAK